MSYILDALRKAERERELAKVPTLASVHQSAEAPPRRLWPWIALVVILANVGAIAWLVTSPPGSGVQATQEPSAAAPAATAPDPRPVVASGVPEPSGALVAEPAPPAAVPSPPPAPQPAPERENQVTVARPPVPAPRAPVAEPGRAPEGERQTAAARPPAAAVAPTPRKEPVAPSPAAAGPSAPARAAAPPLIASTPDRPAVPAPSVAPPAAPAPSPRAAAQDVVGKMRLQFLVYSEVPTERLVFINNQKYLEGQSIDGKLTVERITPDSVVLGYQGERFVLRAESSGPR